MQIEMDFIPIIHYPMGQKALMLRLGLVAFCRGKVARPAVYKHQSAAIDHVLCCRCAGSGLSKNM